MRSKFYFPTCQRAEIIEQSYPSICPKKTKQHIQLFVYFIIVILISFSNSVFAGDYSSAFSQNVFKSYVVESQTSVVPFLTHDQAKACVPKIDFSSQEIKSVSYLNLACPDYLLHNVIRFAVDPINKVSIFYSKNLSSQEIAKIKELSTLLKINATPSSNVSTPIFIGKNNSLAYYTSPLNSGSYKNLVRISENTNATYVVILTNSVNDTLFILNKLISVYTSYYLSNSCVILEPCLSFTPGPDLDSNNNNFIDTVEIFDFASKWYDNKIDSLSFKEALVQWENS